MKPWHIFLPDNPSSHTPWPASLILLFGFAGLIIIGTILLLLPISSQSGEYTNVIDAFFTATSAVCVTGLIVFDTADYWSFFGRAVIFLLIQLGGFGFMTSATIFLLALRRRIGLQERLLISESLGLTRLGNLVSLVKKTAVFCIAAEIIGAIIFMIQFSADFSFGKAAWLSLFHSVSAFNNAGFDLFGGYQSLTGYNDNALVLITTALLIITGGISYLVLSNVITVRKWDRFTLDTKFILVTTAALLIIGIILVMITEWNNTHTLGLMPFSQKLLNAFFLSATARTAGFSSINMGNWANYTLFFTMLLMFIGGASGSTAGGIKVNTLGTLIATVWATVKGKVKPEAFGRQLNGQLINRAVTLIMVSLGVISLSVFLLTITEDVPFLNLLFETFSAFGTVGLSTGITPGLSIAGRIIIIGTMFIGRLGPLTLVLALVQRQKTTLYKYPEEQIRIG